MLDLNDVALFAAAARRLGLPANMIGRRLQEFERRVGQRLLQRSTRARTTAIPVSPHIRMATAVTIETRFPNPMRLKVSMAAE